jgi:NDP-sugar pyrophosphorylase family protein
MEKPTLVVLAAGIGSRYGGLKQIEPVGPQGELIIDYSIYDALRAGFGQVVFVIKEDLERAFRQRVGRNVEKRCETAYLFQRLDDLPTGFEIPSDRKKPWGTAHATLICKEIVHTPFAVINADDFYGRSAYQALSQYLSSARDDDGLYDFCMVGYPVENTLSDHGHVARGVCTVDQDGYLSEIHERTRVVKFGEGARYTEDGEHWIDIPRGDTVSMNTWGFTPSLFTELEGRFRRFLQENQANPLQPEFFLPEVVGALIREGRARVRVLPSSDRWFGVTYPQDKPVVQQAIRDLVRQGVYPEDLWGEGR